MAIDADDVQMAVQSLTEGIHEALTGSHSSVSFNSEHGEYGSVAGGLFAIATAITKLANAVEGLQPE